MAESNSTAESLMKTSINFLPLNATYNDICKLLDGSVDEVNFPVVLSQGFFSFYLIFDFRINQIQYNRGFASTRSCKEKWIRISG